MAVRKSSLVERKKQKVKIDIHGKIDSFHLIKKWEDFEHCAQGLL